MKISQYLCTLMISSTSIFGFAESGINFKNISLEEAKEIAANSNKLIFIDAYADWCGPCKWMEANTFTDQQVGQFFNENIISLQIDMESEIGMEFDLEYIVDVYPTLLIIDSEGEVVKRYTGAMDASEFLKFGQLAIDPGSSQVKKLEEEINYSDYNPETIIKYITACTEENEEPKTEIVEMYLDLLEEKGKKDASQIAEYLLEVQMYDRNANSNLVSNYFSTLDNDTLLEDVPFTIFFLYQNELDAPSTIFFVENFEEISSVWGSYAQDKFTDLVVTASEEFKNGNLKREKIYSFAKLFAEQNDIEYKELKNAIDELLNT